MRLDPETSTASQALASQEEMAKASTVICKRISKVP